MSGGVSGSGFLGLGRLASENYASEHLPCTLFPQRSRGTWPRIPCCRQSCEAWRTYVDGGGTTQSLDALLAGFRFYRVYRV